MQWSFLVFSEGRKLLSRHIRNCVESETWSLLIRNIDEKGPRGSRPPRKGGEPYPGVPSSPHTLANIWPSGAHRRFCAVQSCGKTRHCRTYRRIRWSAPVIRGLEPAEAVCSEASAWSIYDPHGWRATGQSYPIYGLLKAYGHRKLPRSVAQLQPP
jgi:hypothetical protein